MAGRTDGREGEVEYGVSEWDNNVTCNEQKDVPQYTLQGVLHFLQTEWTRIEAQRSDWETQRAELKARIAFLEGERQGQENLKHDLIRRIKMLEYALKQERVKFHNYKNGAANNTSQPRSDDNRAQAPSARPEVDARYNALEPGEKLAQCTEKAFESNAKWMESRMRLKKVLREIGCTDAVLNVKEARILQLLNTTPDWRNAFEQPGRIPSLISKQSPFKDGSWPINQSELHRTNRENVLDEPFNSALNAMDEAIRDGSGGSVNPMSSTKEPGVEHAEPDTTGQSLGGSDAFDSSDGVVINRFRRTVVNHSSEQNRSIGLFTTDETGERSSFVNPTSSFGSSPEEVKRLFSGSNVDKTFVEFMNTLSGNPEDLSNALAAPATNTSAGGCGASTENQSSVVTNTQTDPPQSEVVKMSNASEGLVLGDLASLTVANEREATTEGDIRELSPGNRYNDDPLVYNNPYSQPTAGDVKPRQGSASAQSGWTVHYNLRCHFDGVRGVAFHPTDPAVFTAGEDGCVMFWNLSDGSQPTSNDQAEQILRPHKMVDLEPAHVFCGHMGPVLSLTTPSAALSSRISTAAFTGGMDGSIRGWRIPSTTSTSGTLDLYAPHSSESVAGSVFRGSSEAVWSIALHPSDPLLAAAHADNKIEFWSAEDSDTQPTPSCVVSLDQLFIPPGADSEPLGRATCLQYVLNRPDSSQASQCVIGTSTGWLFLLDVETGQIVSQCAPAPAPQSSPIAPDVVLPDGWSSRAMNALATNYTLSLIIGAHEDGFLRFYDINRAPQTRGVVSTIPFIEHMVAHTDSITSLALDPQGLYLLTGSHDTSIRLWDLEWHSCIRERTFHRSKNQESIHAVAFHPQLPLAASAGADAICRIYDTTM